MSRGKNILITVCFALSVGLIASGAAVFFVAGHYRRLPFEVLNGVYGKVLEQEPEAGKLLFAALKEYTAENAAEKAKESETEGQKVEGQKAEGREVEGQKVEGSEAESQEEKEEQDVLSPMGYGPEDFSRHAWGQSLLSAAAGVLAGMTLLLLTFLYRNKEEAGRIRALTEYLEQVNTGRPALLAAVGEDDFSRLQDEIYKTVTYLYQTRDAAVEARNAFAENLSNIAHQIKTPITAISLSMQMMRQSFGRENSPSGQMTGQTTGQEFGGEGGNRHLVRQVEKQLSRLTHLEEALLVLSRIDAGTLTLDVFTLLVLAADNLQELFAGTHTSVDIPELGEMRILADLDWTMEAVMNLMKNCMEHGSGGTVHCSYEQNPLYTEILVWDQGEGFDKDDITNLFKRFYRGKNARGEGTGIGLALAKEIIECQNGTIRAQNRPEGGACFEIRFYSH